VPFSDGQSVMHPELWDPATEEFTTMAAMTVPRNYHSVALLLPDGRVFSGGGGLCGPCNTNHTDGQVFTPPYLFDSDGSPATRPVITTAPATATAGDQLTVSTAAAVSSFSLVRNGSSTHSLDTDQRRVPLTPTSHTGTTYTMDLPADHGVLVPGYYMLFAMDAHGVPSVSKSVRIT
jgi:galactose oxidase